MFQHILVTLDGSTSAEQALPVAVRIAHTSGASLTLLRVVTPATQFAVYPMGPEILPELINEVDLTSAKNYLSEVASLENMEGIAIQTKVVVGTPAQSIITFAEEHHVDLIVMCSHVDMGLKRLIMGSVAQSVARHSPIPVLFLRKSGIFPPASAEDTMHPIRILVAL